MNNIHTINHPVCENLLGQLRSVQTTPNSFRRLANNLTYFLAIEATRSLQTELKSIQTPVAKASVESLTEEVGIFPILRAGLFMTDPILEIIPTASTYHLGMYRNEETAEPVEYYNKLSLSNPVDVAIVVDPMLATGGSACMAIDALQRWGVTKIKMLSIIASREGIERVASLYKEIDFHCCAIDPILNEKKYIVPGLGDAGDRIFNT